MTFVVCKQVSEKPKVPTELAYQKRKEKERISKQITLLTDLLLARDRDGKRKHLQEILRGRNKKET